jgi:hypothetical protein
MSSIAMISMILIKNAASIITMPMKDSAVFILDYTVYMYHDLIVVTVVIGTFSSYNLEL